MRGWTARTLVGIAVVFGLGLGARAVGAADFKYVGAKKCKTCHKKELIGNQWAKWEEADHAKAFDTLKGEEAIKIAKEKGIAGPPSEAGECLECHATAYGLDASQVDKPLKVADGVQCESCHGPGSDYKKKKVMADHDKAVAAGLLTPDEDTCKTCHNDKSPTFEGFDYKKALEEIAHPIPEDVKGKYLEVEKQRKKEGAGG
jgi:hypothetical protein